MGKRKTKDSRGQELFIVNSLQYVEASFQDQPSNPNLVDFFSITKHELRKLQYKKIQGARIKSRTICMTLGDKGSRFFFKSLKVKEVRDKIRRECESNKYFNDYEGILDLFTQFYTNLFSTKDKG